MPSRWRPQKSVTLADGDRWEAARSMMSILQRLSQGSLRFVAALVLVGSIAACATPPQDPEDREAYEAANDPAQPVNEVIFEFNLIVDKVVLRPLARIYEFVLPDIARDGVRNFLNNLRTPVILANDLMQGEVDRAGETIGRFMINTATSGGVFDVAGEAGITFHEEDFGQTLAVWGADEGAYVMLPFLGPSNVRDAGGKIVDHVLDPLTWWGYNDDDWIAEKQGLIRGVTQAVDARSRNYKQIEDLEATSLDFYATVRSLYRQQRENLIRNGGKDQDAPMPGLGFDMNDPMDDPLETSAGGSDDRLESMGPQANLDGTAVN